MNRLLSGSSGEMPMLFGAYAEGRPPSKPERRRIRLARRVLLGGADGEGSAR
jgi:hypothetical protein